MSFDRRPSVMKGFSLVELMIAMALGLIVMAGVIVVFIAQRQVYNNANSQALMQDADNAIAATVTPVARGVGFLGCSAFGSVSSSLPALPTTLTYELTSAVTGYTGTLPASVTENAANSTTNASWKPSLDSSIVTNGGAEPGSDILVLMGAQPFASPIGVTTALTTSTAALTVNDATQLTTGAQVVAVSDCGKSSVLEATAVSGTSVTLKSAPIVSYLAGAQLIPLQQTMFYVGKGTGGQSGLFKAVMTIPAGSTIANASWVASEMVPGVIAMKVLYGIGSSEAATEYVDASAVSNWGSVTTVKIAFLVEGALGSTSIPTSAWSYSLFEGTDTISVPADSRMRHVFYMTINTRNNTL